MKLALFHVKSHLLSNKPNFLGSFLTNSLSTINLSLSLSPSHLSLLCSSLSLSQISILDSSAFVYINTSLLLQSPHTPHKTTYLLRFLQKSSFKFILMEEAKGKINYDPRRIFVSFSIEIGVFNLLRFCNFYSRFVVFACIGLIIQPNRSSRFWMILFRIRLFLKLIQCSVSRSGF